MSEVASAPLRVHRLTPLPDAFWRGVRETPWRYDLFQLLRRIDAQGGERYPLGRAPLPKFEPLRIGQQPSMSFAPSTLAQVRQREENGLHEVSILSFGLFGPNGPLPVHMTEYARERIHHHQDTSLSAFADLFHHRLTLLFYRAWADAQPAVSLDRADNKRFEGYLASLIGMGQPGQMNKGSLSSHARFTHAGHLTRHGRDPEGLEKIPPGSGGLITLPYFAGERTPINDPAAKGVVFGLKLTHTRRHLYRSALEAVGYSVRQHLDVIRDHRLPLKKIMAVGGGAQNGTWMQLVADITGEPIQVAAVSVGAAYGDALMAALGAGRFQDFSQLSKYIATERTYQPDMEQHQKYEPYFQMYGQLYRQTKELMHQLDCME